MEQISNKTLTFLLIAAIVVSIGGTIVSVNRINKLSQARLITGMAGTGTGLVNLSVAAVSSITIIDSTIQFGSCAPNATGTNLSSNNSAQWGAPGVCTVAGSAVTAADNISIQNDGNKNLNISVKTARIAGTTFIGGTNPQFYFSSRNASARGGCKNSTGLIQMPDSLFNTTGVQWEWRSFAAANTEYLACANLTYQDIADEFYLFAKIFIPSDAPVGAETNTTLTFTASTI